MNVRSGFSSPEIAAAGGADVTSGLFFGERVHTLVSRLETMIQTRKVAVRSQRRPMEQWRWLHHSVLPRG